MKSSPNEATHLTNNPPLLTYSSLFFYRLPCGAAVACVRRCWWKRQAMGRVKVIFWCCVDGEGAGLITHCGVAQLLFSQRSQRFDFRFLSHFPILSGRVCVLAAALSLLFAQDEAQRVLIDYLSWQLVSLRRVRQFKSAACVPLPCPIQAAGCAVESERCSISIYFELSLQQTTNVFHHCFAACGAFSPWHSACEHPTWVVSVREATVQ